jgi:hypothetical protein
MSKIETSGYKGWWPMMIHEGRNPDDSMRGSQGFKNVTTGETVVPRDGWNGEPPGPTGDLACCHHASEAYRRGYDQINWEKAPCQQ